MFLFLCTWSIPHLSIACSITSLSFLSPQAEGKAVDHPTSFFEGDEEISTYVWEYHKEKNQKRDVQLKRIKDDQVQVVVRFGLHTKRIFDHSTRPLARILQPLVPKGTKDKAPGSFHNIVETVVGHIKDGLLPELQVRFSFQLFYFIFYPITCTSND